MSQPDFYAIFGLPPSASQDEIRATHRELVKRYHPDIYSTGGDIARATEKLREINEAYAVLGNTERRKKYDASRVEQRRSASVAQQRPPYVRVRSPARPRASPSKPIRARRKLQWKKFFTFRLIVGAITGAILFVVTAYFFTRAPDVLPAWVLWHKTELEPAATEPVAGAKGWEQLGSFSVRAECARVLKTHVRADQEQGSRAVFDESNGTMAITVLLSESDASNAKKLLEGQRTVTKRVRHYECRAVQVRQPDSWLRRKMRQAGLVP